MKHRISIGVHVLSLISCFITIATNIAAVFGAPWWKFKPTGNEYGILRKCSKLADSTFQCQFRDDIFGFEYMTVYEELKLDVILILLIISTSMAIFGMLTSLLMFSCRVHRKSWFLGCVSTGIMTLLGAVSGYGGVIYAHFFGNRLPGYTRGWPNIIAWLSATTLFFSAIFTLLLIFLPPKGQDGGVINLRPASNYPVFINSGRLNGSATRNDYGNRGYVD